MNYSSIPLKTFTAGILASLILIVSCSKPAGNKDPEPSGFDKSAMLVFYADSMILPAYINLQVQLDLLDASSTLFLASPDENNQNNLKSVFKKTYQSFEQVSVYQLGPAEKALFTNFFNTFPTDTAAIELNVKSGTADLRSNFSINQQGLPALDYLYFNVEALNQFNNGGAASRKKYVSDLLVRMKSLLSTVIDGWKNAYRAEFIANTRSDAGSSISFLVNQMAFEMDQMKGPRIGWPYGKQSGGVQYPQNTEAYQSGISSAIATANLKNLKIVFTGAGSGKGFSDYLTALNKQQLSKDVITQFDVAINSLIAIPDPLSSALTNNKPELDAAYKEIQLLLTLIKTDVASALSVRITYQDTDGD